MLDLLVRHKFLEELVMSTLIGLGVYSFCAIIVIAAELRQRSDMSVYTTRHALNDLAYVVFYQCSIYNIVVLPLFAFLAPRLHFARAGLLLRLPPIAAFFVCWLIFDFLNYWMHRVQHAVRPLWAFHSVHHTQTRLTFLTANRIHVLEQLYVGLLMIIPAFLLGMPQPRWLPILMVQVFSETMQHSRLTWTFGPLRRLLVSPAFHSMHHSVDARQYNGNYGRVFSLWDALFGTFVHADEPALRQGVEGMAVPETLIAQFIHPFRVLAGARVSERLDSGEVHVS
ncbi:MAG TPA: sterol desaturase family protein [Thermoanaerobaculia bacterium]|jgi:sterol desaturase/sphingolipid hydroxylase (fatty acid hydroxylase superfamily)|nr:sterol desaturase family protein [Thermoanaerobaculia bacterium]